MIDDGDCGEIGGIKIGRQNRSTRRKPTLEPLCPPQVLLITKGKEHQHVRKGTKQVEICSAKRAKIMYVA
jgi:hypothetical protein